MTTGDIAHTIWSGLPAVDRTDPKHPKGLCSVPDCEKYGQIVKGLCRKHYMRLLRHGDVSMTLTRTEPTLQERFDKQVDKSTDGCWIWQGSIKNNGYGTIRYNRATLHAHRVSYELHVGPIPAGLVIDHLCRNRACVRPDHLETVTQQVNSQRGAAGDLRYLQPPRARKTHCKHGHEFTPENTRTQGDWRVCRACHRLAEARRYNAKKAGAA